MNNADIRNIYPSDNYSVVIVVDDNGKKDSNGKLNATVVVPNLFLLEKNNGAVPMFIEVVVHGDRDESREQLLAFLNKKAEDFDSYISYVNYLNDVANSWEEISNALGALKNSQQLKTVLAKINIQGLIDNGSLSNNITLRNKIEGNLRNSVQLPSNINERNSGATRDVEEKLKRQIVSYEKTSSEIKKVSTLKNTLRVNKLDFPSLDYSREDAVDNKTSNKYVGKASSNESVGGKTDLFKEQGKIYVGSDMIFDNYSEADTSLSVIGKSVANCFNQSMFFDTKSVLFGNIDKTSKDNVWFMDKHGSANIAPSNDKSNIGLYSVKQSKQQFISFEYFIQMPKNISDIRDDKKNVRAVIMFSDGTKKQVSVKIVGIAGSSNFVPAPIQSATVSVTQNGNNMLSVNVCDANTTTVNVFRRERQFTSNKIKGKMKKIGNISIEGLSTKKSNGGAFTFIDRNVKSQGIIYEYRLVSSNKYGDSFDFFDVVSKPSSSSGGTFKQERIENQSGVHLKEGAKKISVEIDNIHPSIRNVTLLKRNLTLRESGFTKTEHVVSVGTNKTVNFEDTELKEWNEYEYSYVAEDRFGNVSKGAMSQTIKYQRNLSDDPDGDKIGTKINVETNDGTSKSNDNKKDSSKKSTSKNDDNKKDSSSSNDDSSKKSNSFKLEFETNKRQDALPNQDSSDILFTSLREKQQGEELTSTVYSDEFSDKKDDLSKDLITYKVDVIDVDNKKILSSGHISGKKFDSSAVKGLDNIDLQNNEYRIVVTTAAVDLDKFVDENKRKDVYIERFGTIPSLRSMPENILDDSVVNVVEVKIGSDSSNKTTLIKNVRKRKVNNKYIVSWDSTNDRNVDFYIVEKSALDESYPWKYVGKTMSMSLENKMEMTMDVIAGAQYRVRPFYTFNVLGETSIEGGGK
jgi:hypothetical protein